MEELEMQKIENNDTTVINLCKLLLEKDRSDKGITSDYIESRNKCLKHLMDNNFNLNKCNKDILKQLYNIIINREDDYCCFLGPDKYKYDTFHDVFIPGRNKLLEFIDQPTNIESYLTWKYDNTIANQDLINLCIILVWTDTHETLNNYEARPVEYFEVRNKCLDHIINNNFILEKCDREILQIFHDQVIYAEYICNKSENQVLGQILEYDTFDYVYVPGRDLLKNYLEIQIAPTIQIMVEDLHKMNLDDFVNILGEKEGEKINNIVNSLLHIS